jgi:hypothetical protein
MELKAGDLRKFDLAVISARQAGRTNDALTVAVGVSK